MEKIKEDDVELNISTDQEDYGDLDETVADSDTEEIISKSLAVIIAFDEDHNSIDSLKDTINNINEYYKENISNMILNLYILSNNDDNILSNIEKELDEENKAYTGHCFTFGSDIKNPISKYNNLLFKKNVIDEDWFMILPYKSNLSSTFFHDIRVYLSMYSNALSINFNVNYKEVDYENAREDSLYGRIFNTKRTKNSLVCFSELNNFAILDFCNRLDLYSNKNGIENISIRTDIPYLKYYEEDQVTIDKNNVDLLVSKSYFIRDYSIVINYLLQEDNSRYKLIFYLLMYYFTFQYIEYTYPSNDLIIRMNESYAKESIKNIEMKLGKPAIKVIDENEGSLYNSARSYAINLFGNFIETQSILDWIL